MCWHIVKTDKRLESSHTKYITQRGRKAASLNSKGSLWRRLRCFGLPSCLFSFFFYNTSKKKSKNHTCDALPGRVIVGVARREPASAFGVTL